MGRTVRGELLVTSDGTDRDSIAAGTVLAHRYRIRRKLGQGGMGAVYEAEQLDLRRPVAIKVLRPEHASSPTAVERFRREAEVSARLLHANVAQTTGFVADPGAPPFFVMELVQGRSLERTIEAEGPMSQERVAFIAMQLLDALVLAHSQGIVHRDVKPSNLMLTSVANVNDIVKLLDFGVAKIVDEDRITKITHTGAFLGTPGFMATEQALGGVIDARTDLYALGAVMYFALTKRLPYHAKTYAELLIAIVQQEAVPVASLRPDLDPAFAAIVMRALRKPKEERFASATAMREAVMPFVGRTPSAMPRSSAAAITDTRASTPIVPPTAGGTQAGGSTPPRAAPSPKSRRGPWIAIAFAMLAAAAAGGGVVALVVGASSAREPPPITTLAAEPVPASVSVPPEFRPGRLPIAPIALPIAPPIAPAETTTPSLAPRSAAVSPADEHGGPSRRQHSVATEDVPLGRRVVPTRQGATEVVQTSTTSSVTIDLGGAQNHRDDGEAAASIATSESEPTPSAPSAPDVPSNRRVRVLRDDLDNIYGAVTYIARDRLHEVAEALTFCWAPGGERVLITHIYIDSTGHGLMTTNDEAVTSCMRHRELDFPAPQSAGTISVFFTREGG